MVLICLPGLLMVGGSPMDRNLPRSRATRLSPSLMVAPCIRASERALCCCGRRAAKKWRHFRTNTEDDDDDDGDITTFPSSSRDNNNVTQASVICSRLGTLSVKLVSEGPCSQSGILFQVSRGLLKPRKKHAGSRHI